MKAGYTTTWVGVANMATEVKSDEKVWLYPMTGCREAAFGGLLSLRVCVTFWAEWLTYKWKQPASASVGGLCIIRLPNSHDQDPFAK